MRVAVALPTLPSATPLGRGLQRVFSAMREGGVDVEAFAEKARAGEWDGVPLYHYLRFPERHSANPFDQAIWPLGRDVSSWEPAWLLSRRFPGQVWVLDAALHHLALGGVALPGHWSLFGRWLAGRDRDTRARAFHLFASGWGSRAAARAHDPVIRSLASGRVVAATAPVEAELRRVGLDSLGVLPLPAPEASAHSEAEDAAEAPVRISIMSVDVSRPGRILAELGPFLDRHPTCTVTVTAPAPVFHVRLAPVAHECGVLSRLRWSISPELPEVLEEASSAHVVLLLDTDATATDRGLLEAALSNGSVCAAVTSAALEDIPEPPLVRLRPGRALGPSLGVLLEELTRDGSLWKGLGAAGRQWVSQRPGPAEIAARWTELLAAAPTVAEVPSSGRVWSRLQDGMRSDCVPAGSEAVARSTIMAALRSVLPAAGRRAVEDEPT